MRKAQHSRPKSRLPLFLSIGIVCLVLIAFAGSAWFEFTGYDDPEWVSSNHSVQAGFKFAGFSDAFRHPILGHWAPLTVLSHMAVCQVFGLNAGAHHLVNVGLHAFAAILLFQALRTLTGATWRSAAVAVFFAIHPLRAESVVWVAECKDVLSAVFFFLTLPAYASWTRHPNTLRYLWVVLLTAAGLMSKSMLVSLPGVLLLLDFWPLGRLTHLSDLKSRVLEKIPLCALAVGAAILQYSIEPAMIASTETLSVGARLANAIVTYAIYAGQLFWPGPLSVFYPHPGMPPLWQIGTASAALLAVTGAVWRYGRDCRYLWVGWLWFLGMLLPVIGIVQAGEIGRADRYTYLAQVGLLIMLMWGIEEVTREWERQRVVLGCTATICAILALVFTRAQASTWRNEETLWSHALAVSPDNYRAHYSLGVVEAGRGHLDLATTHFREAARLLPGDFHAYAALGKVLLATGDNQGAIAAATEAVRRNPGDTALSLGREFQKRRILPTADWCFEESMKARPDDIEPAFELAKLRYETGHQAEAVRLYEAVLQRNDAMAQAQANLAWILATAVDDSVRNGPEAVKWATRANETVHGTNPMVLRILAAAYAEAGQYPEALATIDRGTASARQHRDRNMLGWLEADRALFQARRPLRLPTASKIGQ